MGNPPPQIRGIQKIISKRHLAQQGCRVAVAETIQREGDSSQKSRKNAFKQEMIQNGGKESGSQAVESKMEGTSSLHTPQGMAEAKKRQSSLGCE